MHFELDDSRKALRARIEAIAAAHGADFPRPSHRALAGTAGRNSRMLGPLAAGGMRISFALIARNLLS